MTIKRLIALVGSGEYLPAMELVDRNLLARLTEPARVVCLPTAAGTEGPERIDYWARLGVDHFQRLGVAAQTVPVIDRASADNADFAAIVASASFVYLSGGKPDYLYQSLAGSAVWAAIETMLARGGILAGCSAGAMILGEKFFGFPGWRQGFGYVPGATIIPHFDEIPALMVQSMRLFAGDMTVLGIDGNTALVHHSDGYEVVGAGGITVWNKAGKIRYTQGLLPGWIA